MGCSPKIKLSLGGQRGQGAMEFVLILAMIVGVILTLFTGVLQPKMEKIQEALNDKALGVLRQDQLGIPLAWFDGKYSDLNGATASLDAAGGGGDRLGGENGSGNGKDRNGDGKDGDGSGKGKDGKGDGDGKDKDGLGADGAGRGGRGGGAGGGGRNGRASGSSSASARGSGSSRRGGGGGNGSDEDEGDTESGSSGSSTRRRRNDSASSEGNYDSNAGPEKEADKKKTGLNGEGGGDKKSDGEFINGKRVRGENFDRERQSGSCQDMNIFAVLKIIAILLVLVLGAVVLFMGNKKDQGDL